MKSVMPFAVVFAGLAWSGVARADQCELVDDAVATRAVKALSGHPEVIQFCEPCQDKAPGAPIVAKRVEKTRDATGDYEIVIDRREVDLAYTYVKTSPSHYENVAMIAGCPTSGVTPSLSVEDVGDNTPAVLILPDPTPVAQPQPVIVPQLVLVQRSSGLLEILLACVGVSTLWAVGTLAIINRRRRVAMRPRAIDLRKD